MIIALTWSPNLLIMRKLFLPLLVLVAITQGCQKSEKKKAFEFNQKLAAISLNLNTKGQGLGTDLKAAFTSHDFSKVRTTIDSLGKFVDQKIEELKATENVAGSEKLKESMLDFLNFEKTMINKGFEPFANMDENTSEAEIQDAIKNMSRETENENDYLAKVRDEQKKYADKNGFKIASK